jgi:outer membrane protein TolC
MMLKPRRAFTLLGIAWTFLVSLAFSADEADPPPAPPLLSVMAPPPAGAHNSIDWELLDLPEGLAEPVSDQLGGFLGIDPAAEPPPPIPGAEGPFDYLPGAEEEDFFSIEEMERLYGPSEPDPGLAGLTLRDCARLALERNFGLANAARDLASSASQRRAQGAEFIPFVELVYDYDYVSDKTARTRRQEREAETPDDQLTRTRERERTTNHGEVRVTQNLPWGGSVGTSVGATEGRNRDRLFATTEVVESEDPTVPGSVVFIDSSTDVSRDYRSDAAFTYTQPLLRGAGWTVGTAELRRAQLDEMDQALSYRLSQRDVALQIISAYYAVARAELDLRVSREALREIERFLEETRIRHELGRIPESEISRAEVQFLQEKQTYISRLQTYEARVDDLLEATGLPLQASLSLAPVEGQLIDARLARVPPLQEGIREALAARLEIARSDIALARAELALDLAENDILPDLNLDANWVGLDESDSNDDIDEPENRRRYDVGLSLNVPLPNIARREALWRTKLALESARNSREQQDRSVIREVKAAYRDLRAAEARLRILAKTVEQARRSLAQENARFEVGLNTSTEVRNAQDDLFSAQSDYNQALLDVQIAVSQLYRALGRPIF